MSYNGSWTDFSPVYSFFIPALVTSSWPMRWKQSWEPDDSSGDDWFDTLFKPITRHQDSILTVLVKVVLVILVTNIMTPSEVWYVFDCDSASVCRTKSLNPWNQPNLSFLEMQHALVTWRHGDFIHDFSQVGRSKYFCVCCLAACCWICVLFWSVVLSVVLPGGVGWSGLKLPLSSGWVLLYFWLL